MGLAGEIEETGKDVRRFQRGERVYAFTGLRFGSYAQYTCLPQSGIIAPAPRNLTYEEAAAVPHGGLLALHYLRKGNSRNEQQALVYGAPGAVGISAIQLARHFGARVTAVCSSANLELAKSLGADAVIDYTKQHALGGRDLYNVVLDAVGKRKTSRLKVACKNALAPGGIYVSVDDGRPRFSTTDLALLKDVEAGTFRPVIDRAASPTKPQSSPYHLTSPLPDVRSQFAEVFFASSICAFSSFY